MPKRSEMFLFLATFVAFAYFHQGGGWNQNSRFAMVRAMAEERAFTIDNFLVYEAGAAGKPLLRRRVRNGDFEDDEGTKRLCWTGHGWDLHPVNGVPGDDEHQAISLEANADSGDVGFFEGHFHPNKPPGTSFLALPGYLLLLTAERMFGANPDDWWVLTCNEWLTSVLSVGLFSALGCRAVFPDRDAAGSGKRARGDDSDVRVCFWHHVFPVRDNHV